MHTDIRPLSYSILSRFRASLERLRDNFVMGVEPDGSCFVPLW